MPQTTVSLPGDIEIPPSTLEFYRNVLEILNRNSLPYLVGGAYAFNYHTGLNRYTRDFDIFIAQADYDRISKVLIEVGYNTELTYPHWLAKVHFNGDFIDLIFSSGNGIAEVDKVWFDYAVPAEILGIETKICPVEETIWSKAFIMERERFDGADVAHLILTCGQKMDWPRLASRFTPHWRLLLCHLVLFGFIYPTHRDLVPTQVMDELLNKLKDELNEPSPKHNLCGGTLLSREQYLNDISQFGYQDARVTPHGKMTEQDTAKWTAAINHNKN